MSEQPIQLPPPPGPGMVAPSIRIEASATVIHADGTTDAEVPA